MTGATTLAGLSATGNATIGGTLAVTGATTLSTLETSGAGTVNGSFVADQLATSSNLPAIQMTDENAGTDLKTYRFTTTDGGEMRLAVFNDATTVSENAYRLTRDATPSVTDHRFLVGGTTILHASATGVAVTGSISADTIVFDGNTITGISGNDATLISGTPSAAPNFLAMFDGDQSLVDSGKEIPTGDLVGTTDAQTLTGKTLDSPVFLTQYVFDNTTITGIETLDQVAYNVNVQQGTTYTLAISDQNGIVYVDNASSPVVTIPLNASVAFEQGTIVEIIFAQAGSIAMATGGVLRGVSNGSCTVPAQGAVRVVLIDPSTNTWHLAGEHGTVS